MVSSTDSRGRLDRLLTAVAVALAAAAVLAVLTAARLALIVGASWQELVNENEATNAILGLAFGLLGALAVADRPRNGLSWLFVAEGSTNALTALAARWVAYAEQGRPDTPLVGLAAWVGDLGTEALVVSLGVDAAADDPESPLLVTADGYADAGGMLAALGLPTVAVQEGGYHLPSLGRLVAAYLGGHAG